ncbi:hypothetical protein P2318_29785 [Myxococcaceae bacterium GXIMD 01537]
MAASEERRFEALVLSPVRRVQRRLNAVAWAEAGLVPVWATATACVLARLLLRDMAVFVIPLALGLGALAWVRRARARRVTLAQAAVLADRSAEAGGLLLTRLERPVGEWELLVNQHARAVKPPPVRWRRPVGALVGALLFLVGGFLLPLPAWRSPPVNAAAAAKVASVQAKAEALAQEEALGEPLEAELKRLAEEVASGRFDAADWEAADGVERALETRAAEAAAELARAAEAARELGEALGAAGGAERAAREREELEAALMALGHDGQEGSAGREGSQGGPEGQEGAEGRAGQGGKVPDSPAQLADLRGSLERRQKALERRFGQQGTGTGEGEGEGEGQGSEGRARRPGREGQGRGREGEGEGHPGESQGGHASRGVGEGKGGVGRGGDTRPLVFGDEARMDPDRLAFKPLPQGHGGESAELWGLKAADPRVLEGRAPAGGARGTGARGDATAGHGAAPLLPRNRELVKRYFGGE